MVMCSRDSGAELLLQEIGCGGADVGARRSVLPEFSFAFDQQAWTALSAGWALLPSQAYKTGFPRCLLEAVLEGPTRVLKAWKKQYSWSSWAKPRLLDPE
jgi:hypothetical protein